MESKLTKKSLPELERLTVEQYREQPTLPVVLVLENIRSLNNVGSMFRSADAFRVERIMLTGYTGTPPHRKIEHAALGGRQGRLHLAS